ncbi:MAG: hypothetical protein ACRCYO_02795 [Bacteroidia bacterium]
MRHLVLKCVLFFSFCLTSLVHAQQGVLPLNRGWMMESEAHYVQGKGFLLAPNLLMYESDTVLKALYIPADSIRKFENLQSEPLQMAYGMATSMRPWLENGHPLRQNGTYYNASNRRRETTGGFGNWLRNYHTHKSFLQVEREPQGDEPLFRLYIDPLLNLQVGKLSGDTSSERLYVNTRGVHARGDIGTKISFETSFLENQAFFPAYLDSFAIEQLVIPGAGRWKTFKRTGYDYASATGLLTYAPTRFFSAQIGHGKLVVGDGYRSLLLSDNGMNYPFARLTTRFGNFQYTNIYASLMNLIPGGTQTPVGTERLFQKKIAAFQHLAWRPVRALEVSLFQGIMWGHTNDRNQQQFGFNYFNPLIFSALPVYGLHNERNFLIGFNLRADLFRCLTLYAQGMMDEKGSGGAMRNKTGYQLGARYFNMFGVKHLHAQVEYNAVRPYAYQASDSLQAWTHYNQPLAHPLGANFTELVGFLNYRWKDIFLEARFSTATVGRDSSGVNWGSNVFLSDRSAQLGFEADGNKTGQGVSNTITTLDVHVGYTISHASNLNVVLGYTARENSAKLAPPVKMIYFSLRTSLSNFYTDF